MHALGLLFLALDSGQLGLGLAALLRDNGAVGLALAVPAVHGLDLDSALLHAAVLEAHQETADHCRVACAVAAHATLRITTLSGGAAAQRPLPPPPHSCGAQSVQRWTSMMDLRARL